MCVFETFFNKNSDGTFSLNENEVFTTVVTDLMNSMQKAVYDEFVQLAKTGIKTYLPYQVFTDRIETKINTLEFLKDVWRAILTKGIVVDYNEYSADGEQFVNSKNVVVVQVNWEQYQNRLEKLKFVCSLKKLLCLEEIVFLFRDFFESKKEFEQFVKFSFNKIVFAVLPKYKKSFLENNPYAASNQNANVGICEYFAYRIKNIWF